MARERVEVAVDGDVDTGYNRSSFTLFRRPGKYHNGEEFDIFAKMLCLSLEAVDITDPKKR